MFGGHLQLGTEVAAAFGGQPVQVGLADVQLRLHGQGQRAAVGVPRQDGQRDPDVAVDVPLAGGAGAGVVMDASALDVGAVARRRRIVDGRAQASSVQQRPDGVQRADRQLLGVAADGADGRVGGAEVVADAGGAEPGGDGAAAGGKEEAAQQQGQAGGRRGVQPVGQVEEGAGQQRRQVRQ